MNPQPASSAPRVLTTKIGASASTAPTAENADDDPGRHRGRHRVLAEEADPVDDVSPDAREVQPPGEHRGRRRDRHPADHRGGEDERRRRRGTAARAWSCPSRIGIAWLSSVFTATSTVKTIPPSGSVPYVEASAIELALASCRRGTRFGQRRVARRPPHEREAFDHEGEGVDRPELAEEHHRRVHRAAADVGGDHDPLAVETVDEGARDRTEQDRRKRAGDHQPGDRERGAAGAAAEVRHERASPRGIRPSRPSEDTDIAASSRANGGWVSRSLSVADWVPRRAATSSATLVTPSLPRWRRPARRRRLPRPSWPASFVARRWSVFGRRLLLGGASSSRLLRRLLLRRRLLRSASRGRSCLARLGLGRARRRLGLPVPGLVTFRSRSASAPQCQQRKLFGRRRSSPPQSGHGVSFSGGLFTAQSHSG